MKKDNVSKIKETKTTQCFSYEITMLVHVISDTETETEEDVNVLEEFVSEEDKKELGIKDWKNLTKMTIRYDSAKNPIKVILRNKFGGSDKVRRIKKGEAGFDAAIKLIDKVKSGIKYN